MYKKILLGCLLVMFNYSMGHSQPWPDPVSEYAAMNTANAYTLTEWTCSKYMWGYAWHNYNHYEDYSNYGDLHTGGPELNHRMCDWRWTLSGGEPQTQTYTGMAYAFGMGDYWDEFIADINISYPGRKHMPGGHECHWDNWRATHQQQNPTWYAGIDCSHLVCNCLFEGSPYYNSTTITSLLNQYNHVYDDPHDAVLGDVITKNGHVRLVKQVVENSIEYWEASADNEVYYDNKCRERDDTINNILSQGYVVGSFYDRVFTSVGYSYPVYIPTSTILYSYPNPFNSSFTLGYEIPRASKLSLKLYNVLGQLQDLLFDGHKKAGVHTLNVNMSDYPSGVYFVNLLSETKSATHKILLVK